MHLFVMTSFCVLSFAVLRGVQPRVAIKAVHGLLRHWQLRHLGSVHILREPLVPHAQQIQL